MPVSYFSLASGSYTQDWSNTGLITVDDSWSGVPYVIGYRGDGLTFSPGADPRTVTADGSATPIDVNANETNPSTLTVGGAGGGALCVSSGVAQRPAMRMPRPIALPRVRQSIQPIVMGQRGAAFPRAPRNSSIVGTRSLSIQTHEVGMR